MMMSGPLLTGYTQTINDWYDREIDAINEPYRPIPSGEQGYKGTQRRAWQASLVWFGFKGPPFCRGVVPHPPSRGAMRQPSRSKRWRYCQGLVLAVAQHQEAPRGSVCFVFRGGCSLQCLLPLGSPPTSSLSPGSPPAASGRISERDVIAQIWVLLLGGLGVAYGLDKWAGHETPTLLILAIFGSFISYIYSAPPLKLKQSGWAGNYALGSSYIALPWWAGQVRGQAGGRRGTGGGQAWGGGEGAAGERAARSEEGIA